VRNKSGEKREIFALELKEKRPYKRNLVGRRPWALQGPERKVVQRDSGGERTLGLGEGDTGRNRKKFLFYKRGKGKSYQNGPTGVMGVGGGRGYCATRSKETW